MRLETLQGGKEMGGGGRLAAEATPLGESEGRDAKGVTTRTPPAQLLTTPTQSVPPPQAQSNRRQTTTSSVTLR
jgi:hypothetical protein